MLKNMLIVVCLFGTGSISAQYPTVDLGMIENGAGQLEIRMRMDGDFDELISGLTFTLRWPASAGIAVDTAVRCYPYQDVMPVNATPVVTNGEYMYRTFNGFSSTLLQWMDLAMYADQEYTICTADLLVPGTAVELVDDEYTDSHNCSYFCSINGMERTGEYFMSPMPMMNIHSQNGGTGSLDIYLSPQGDDFFGWVSQLDFTLRWPSADAIDLGAVVQDPEVAEYLPVNKVGGQISANGYTYQRISGSGLKSIANSQDGWDANSDILLASVPFTGSSEQLFIVNDDWTAVNSGTYRILLNGTLRTGTIEDVSTGISTAPALANRFAIRSSNETIAVDLTLVGGPAPLSLMILNALGQPVWNYQKERASGQLVIQTATGSLPSGQYFVNVRHGDRVMTDRFVR